MTTETWSTSKTLQVASSIAARLERRGMPCTAAEALERAESAQQQLALIKAWEDAGQWDDTVIEPPMPADLLAEVAA